MSANYTPIIKTVDLTSLDYPIRVTIDKKKDDDTWWWKYEPYVPTILKDPKSSIAFITNKFENRFFAYLFIQSFFTIYMYNKLDFDDPIHFYVDDDNNSFYYFINYGEYLNIPLLVKNENLKIILTVFNKMPALKIQSGKQQQHGRGTKRIRT